MLNVNSLDLSLQNLTLPWCKAERSNQCLLSPNWIDCCLSPTTETGGRWKHFWQFFGRKCTSSFLCFRNLLSLLLFYFICQFQFFVTDIIREYMSNFSNKCNTCHPAFPLIPTHCESGVRSMKKLCTFQPSGKVFNLDERVLLID